MTRKKSAINRFGSARKILYAIGSIFRSRGKLSNIFLSLAISVTASIIFMVNSAFTPGYDIALKMPDDACPDLPERLRRGISEGAFDPFTAFNNREHFRSPDCLESLFALIKDNATTSNHRNRESILIDNSMCIISQIGSTKDLDRLFSFVDTEEFRFWVVPRRVYGVLPCLAANENADWAIEYMKKFAWKYEPGIQKIVGEPRQSTKWSVSFYDSNYSDVALKAIALTNSERANTHLNELMSEFMKIASEGGCSASNENSRKIMAVNEAEKYLQLLEIHKIRRKHGFARAFRFQDDMKARYQWNRFDLDRFQRDPAADFELPSLVLTRASKDLLDSTSSTQVQTRIAIVRNLLRTATTWDAGTLHRLFLKVLPGPSRVDPREATADEFDVFLGLLRQTHLLATNTERLLPGSPPNLEQLRWFADERRWRIRFSDDYLIGGRSAQEAAQLAAIAGLDGIAAVRSADSCCVLSAIAGQTPGDEYSEPVLRHARELIAANCPPSTPAPN